VILRVLFLLTASLGVIAALGTVLARNLVHAALFLVGFFFVVACQFVLLDAEFLAAIQVLIYIGAVAILILFGIMLTRNVQGDETTSGPAIARLPGAFAAVAILAVLVAGIVKSTSPGGRPSWSSQKVRPAVAANADDTRSLSIRSGMAPVVGVELLTRYVVAFEVAGLLLTAAVVGAIALAHASAASTPGNPEANVTSTTSRSSLSPDGEAEPAGAEALVS
jgi:NADH-quinone oxidoreductase subunit J